MMRKWLSGVLCFMSFVCLQTLCSSEAQKGKANPTMYCILGKASNIYALTFSPDDKRLLAGEEHEPNDQVVEWDVANKSVYRRFDSNHSGQIVSITYSQSGRLLAIGHLNGFISVRDRSGDILLSFKSIENAGAKLNVVSISEKQGPFVYTVVGHNIAQRRNISTGQTSVYYIPCDGGYRINSSAATRSGTSFVCCSPKFLNVYQQGDFDSPQEIKSFSAFKEPCVTDIAISDDSSMVMAYDYNGELALFNIKDDKLVKKWKGHGGQPVYTILPFHGRNWFATGDDSGEIIIWDEKGDLLTTLKLKDEDHPISALALTRDNRFLASSGENRPIVVWDLRPLLDWKPVQR